MSAIPSADDLSFILAQAQRNWRRAVELSFRTPGGSQAFSIAVKCDIESGEPVWTLKCGESAAGEIVWTHTSLDANLIHYLIASEFNVHKQREQGEAATTEGSAASVACAGQGDKASQPAAGAELEPHLLDWDTLAMEGVVRGLCRPETGILSHPAFLYFVDQEYRRFQRGGLPFSVVIFEISQREPGSRVSTRPLSERGVHEAALRIDKAKRDIDMLAHYGTFELAFLLPHTDPDGAAIFVRRIEKALLASPLLPGLDPSIVSLCFGIAGMPGDADKPRSLVAAALEAKQCAAKAMDNVKLYRDLNRRPF